MLCKKHRNAKKEREMQKRKGFTLIELIVVIVILGIVTAIAVPTIYHSTMQRKGLMNGKAMIINATLGAKTLAASGTDDWQLIFDGSGASTISWKRSDSAAVWRVDTLPHGCAYSGGITITFEFRRDGSAESFPPGSDTFSIENARNERVRFTLIPQIGEVKSDGI
jgi:MSHA pilin protein MshC